MAPCLYVGRIFTLTRAIRSRPDPNGSRPPCFAQGPRVKLPLRAQRHQIRRQTRHLAIPSTVSSVYCKAMTNDDSDDGPSAERYAKTPLVREAVDGGLAMWRRWSAIWVCGREGEEGLGTVGSATSCYLGASQRRRGDGAWGNLLLEPGIPSRMRQAMVLTGIAVCLAGKEREIGPILLRCQLFGRQRMWSSQ